MGADWNTPRREKGDGFSHSLSAFQLHARSVAFLHYTRRAFERLRWRGFIAAKWHIDEDEAMIARSEEHTSELQSLMRISYAVFCLQKKKTITYTNTQNT